MEQNDKVGTRQSAPIASSPRGARASLPFLLPVSSACRVPVGSEDAGLPPSQTASGVVEAIRKQDDIRSVAS